MCTTILLAPPPPGFSDLPTALDSTEELTFLQHYLLGFKDTYE